MRSRLRIKAVPFDLDGTLIDSNHAHVALWDEVFRNHGFVVGRQAIHDQIGKGGYIVVPSLIPAADEPLIKTLSDEHGDISKKKHLARMLPFPVARALLMRVHGGEQKIVFASSASRTEGYHYLGLLDACEIVAATTARGCRKFQAGARYPRWATEEGRAACARRRKVVGDTPYGVEAAARCGIKTVALRSGGFPDEVLLKAGAIILYDHAAALLADYGNSSLGQ